MKTETPQTPQPVRIPAPGTTVMVIPVGAQPGGVACWEATLLSYTPGGQFVVRSARKGATHQQTVTNIYVPVAP